MCQRLDVRVYAVTRSELITLRKSLKLSQTALAERLGLTRDAIARMERGKIAIRPVILMALEHLSCRPRRRKTP